MGSLLLPVDNDARYGDSPVDPSVKDHQRQHDKANGFLNTFDADAMRAATDGQVLALDSSTGLWAPVTVSTTDGGGTSVGTSLAGAIAGSLFRVVYAGGWPSSRPSARTDIFFDLVGAPSGTSLPTWMLAGDSSTSTTVQTLAQNDVVFDQRLAAVEANQGSGQGSVTVNWDQIQLRPNTFPPSAHQHGAGDISDATATGRAVMRASDAAAARLAIGASSLAIGSSGTQAAAGNHTHKATAIQTDPISGITATDVQTALEQIRALISSSSSGSGPITLDANGKIPMSYLLVSDSATASANNLWSSAEVARRIALSGGSTSPFGALRINVQTRGAVGDGVTDDTPFIKQAIIDAGVGGTVFFPATSAYYRITSYLKPRAKQTFLGEGTLEYAWDTNVTGGSIIRASSTFTGPAVIYNDNTTPNGTISNGQPVNGISWGVTFRGMGIFGAGAAGELGTLNGIDLGPTSGRERGWHLDGVRIMYVDTALCGYIWACIVENVHIARCGYGVAAHLGADPNGCIQDTTFSKMFVYFCFHDGFWIGGARQSGMWTIGPDIRVERCGTYFDPTTGALDADRNRDENAVGIRLTNSTTGLIMGVTTDANALHGLMIDPPAGQSVNNVNGAGNAWKRDGTYRNTYLDGNGQPYKISGVYVRGAQKCNFESQTITFGKPDDGGPGRIAPQVGLEFGDCQHFTWHGTTELGRLYAADLSTVVLGAAANMRANAYKSFGTNYRCDVKDPLNSYHSIPYGPTAEAPIPLQGTTLMYWSTSSGGGPMFSVDGAAFVLWAGGSGQAPSTPSSTDVDLTQAAYDALATKDPATNYYTQGLGGLRRHYRGMTVFSEYVAAFVGKRNNFSGVPSGTVLTAGNSGGASGDAFQGIVGTLTVSDAADLTGASGDRGVTASTSGTPESTALWTHPDYSGGAWVRGWVRRPATVTITQRVVKMYGAANTAATERAELRWAADGTFLLTNFAGETLVSVAGASALNTIYRYEFNPVTKQLFVYPGDSLTVIAAQVAFAGVMTAGDWTATRFGVAHTAAQTMALDGAGWAISPNGPIGL